MKIPFIPANKHPQEEGQYLWKSCANAVELVTVREFEGFTGNWWGIVELGGRNVKIFNVNQFSEKVEFVIDSAK